MKKVLKKLYFGCKQIIQAVVSILSVIAFSRPGISRKLKNSNVKCKDICVVLGNGPSLVGELEYLYSVKSEVDFIAVNAFCKSDYFRILQPSNYILLDGQFFAPRDERNVKLSQEVLECFKKVDWPMNLILSVEHRKIHYEERIQNKNITTVYVNDASIGGPEWLRNYIYDKQWGMPKCQTVLIAAIYLPIYLRYKEVYVYGADHSWTRDLRVDENNVLCYGDRHVYNTNLTEIKMQYGIADLLLYYSNMFASHNLLRSYSNHVKVPVYNATEGSFVDAYERKKLSI